MRLYVLVRSDLTPAQSAVQAGHAVAEYMLDSSATWKNSTLIYLKVNSLCHLKKWMNKLGSLGVKYISWREPDINNEVTAIATTGSSEIFRNLNLL